MKIEFLEAAEREFKNAVDYYNGQSEGLGFEFAVEIRKTLERIIQYPEAWVKISKRARRCRCKRFPYGVIYYQSNDLIIIVAVMHLNRKPDYWKDRF